MESTTTSVASEPRKTALNAMHRKLGARMVNFGGWDMPVEYPATGGLVSEHKAVRGSVGVFDVSHMGDIRIHTGKYSGGALAAVQPSPACLPPWPNFQTTREALHLRIDACS
jgi:aminomethyltransferase